jgi:hypothetical protein
MTVMPCTACGSLTISVNLPKLTGISLLIRWSFFVEVCQQNALRLQEPSRDFSRFDDLEPPNALLNRFTQGKRLETFISLASSSSLSRGASPPWCQLSDEVSVEEEIALLDEFERYQASPTHDDQANFLLSVRAIPYSPQYHQPSHCHSTPPSPHSWLACSSPQHQSYCDLSLYDPAPSTHSSRISPISVVHPVLVSPIRFSFYSPMNPRTFT